MTVDDALIPLAHLRDQLGAPVSSLRKIFADAGVSTVPYKGGGRGARAVRWGDALKALGVVVEKPD